MVIWSILFVISLLGFICFLIGEFAEKPEKHPMSYKICKKISYKILAIIMTMGIISTVVNMVPTLSIIDVKVPYFKDKKLIEYQQKYITLSEGVKRDSGYLLLASDISDYNADVIKGRRALESFWFKDFTYDFWYDLELIDIHYEGV